MLFLQLYWAVNSVYNLA